MKNDRSVRSTDLLPGGDDRYKSRNELRTAYSHKSGRETDFGTRARAEFLNEYHFFLDAGIIATGTAVGLVVLGATAVGTYNLYQTIENIIDKLF